MKEYKANKPWRFYSFRQDIYTELSDLHQHVRSFRGVVFLIPLLHVFSIHPLQTHLQPHLYPAEKMQRKGDRISKRTVGKYMREIGIRTCYRKQSTHTTRNPDFSSGLKNILNRDFQPERPDAAWCTDITYIWTTGGFVYLASIMDLYSRKIISWTLGETLETKWVLEAVEKAKEQRHVTQPLVIHSDRGVQYTCGDYAEATGGMERSYSAKSCPWDNACIESFHALIKREWLSRFRITDYSHAYRLVFEYIEAFYNTVRIHSHCGYRSPSEHEKQYLDGMEVKIRETG